MRKIRNSVFALILAAFALVSCNLPIGSQNSNLDQNAINTRVAQTIAAAQSVNPTIIITATPAAQEMPTITPAPLATLVAPTAIPSTATATPDTCNQASFIDDVTIPDGSKIFSGASFIKTWRVKNVGTCTWNTNYALVTFSGDNLGAPAVSVLPANVPPGGTIDLSVNLTAPASNGKYKQNFKLRSDSGLLFATGANSAYPLYVQIEVIHFYALTLMPTIDFGSLPLLPLETLVYSFANNYCSAVWKYSGTDVLACPGTTSDATGFVVRNDSPYLQDSIKYTGPTLFTHPRWIDNGTIAGFFPALAIQNGYHFKTTLGCGQGGNACDANIQLNYSADGGPTQALQSWNVKYANAPIAVNLDLSSLAGHNVAFVLAVTANGTSAQDWVQWVNPRITK